MEQGQHPSESTAGTATDAPTLHLAQDEQQRTLSVPEATGAEITAQSPTSQPVHDFMPHIEDATSLPAAEAPTDSSALDALPKDEDLELSAVPPDPPAPPPDATPSHTGEIFEAAAAASTSPPTIMAPATETSSPILTPEEPPYDTAEENGIAEQQHAYVARLDGQPAPDDSASVADDSAQAVAESANGEDESAPANGGDELAPTDLGSANGHGDSGQLLTADDDDTVAPNEDDHRDSLAENGAGIAVPCASLCTHSILRAHACAHMSTWWCAHIPLACMGKLAHQAQSARARVSMQRLS